MKSNILAAVILSLCLKPAYTIIINADDPSTVEGPVNGNQGGLNLQRFVIGTGSQAGNPIQLLSSPGGILGNANNDDFVSLGLIKPSSQKRYYVRPLEVVQNRLETNFTQFNIYQGVGSSGTTFNAQGLFWGCGVTFGPIPLTYLTGALGGLLQLLPNQIQLDVSKTNAQVTIPASCNVSFIPVGPGAGAGQFAQFKAQDAISIGGLGFVNFNPSDLQRVTFGNAFRRLTAVSILVISSAPAILASVSAQLAEFSTLRNQLLGLGSGNPEIGVFLDDIDVTFNR